MPASGVIFNGNFVKTLKNNLKLGEAARIYSGDTDNPNSVAKDAPAGSLYIRSGTEDIYVKIDSGSTTSWRKIDADYNTIHLGSADFQTTGDYTTGQNATFDNGGTLGGTFSRSTTTGDLIRGDVAAFELLGSATAGNNTNDWIASAAISIPIGLRGRTLGVNVRIKSDVTAGNVNLVVKDHTNTVILYDEPIQNNNDLNQAQDVAASFFCPSNCTQVKVGFQVKTGEASKTFIFDDVRVTADPFTVAKISPDTDWAAYTLTIGGTGSDPTPGVVAEEKAYWRRSGSDMLIKYTIHQTSSAGATSGSGFYLFPLPAGYTMDSTVINVTSDENLGAVGSGHAQSSDSIERACIMTTASDTELYMYGQDGVVVQAGGNYDFGTKTVVQLTFDASVPIAGWSALEDHVILPAESNLTTPVDFTPTGSWSTNTTYSGKWWRVGNNFNAYVRIALSGAPTAATLDINLPTINGVALTADTDILFTGAQNITLDGSTCDILDSGTVDYRGRVVSTGSTTAVRPQTFLDNGSSERLTNINATTPFTFASGDEIVVFFSVPILQWRNSGSRFLAAVPGTLFLTASTNAGLSVSDSTVTPVVYEDIDSESNISSWYNTTTGIFTAQESGFYIFSASATWTDLSVDATELMRIHLYKNGAVRKTIEREFTATNAAMRESQWITSGMYLLKNETASIRVWHNTGVAESLDTASDSNRLTIYKRW